MKHEAEEVSMKKQLDARIYRIRFKGQLGPDWADWFDGLTVTSQANGEILLSGEIVDQAALYGILLKAQRLALPLLSVEVVEAEENPLSSTELI